MKSIDLKDEKFLASFCLLNGSKAPEILIIEDKKDPFPYANICDELLADGVFTGYGYYNEKDNDRNIINCYWFDTEEQKNLFILRYF